MRAVKGALTMPRLSHLRVVAIAARIEGSMQGSHMKSLRMMKRPARDERYHEDRDCVELSMIHRQRPPGPGVPSRRPIEARSGNSHPSVEV